MIRGEKHWTVKELAERWRCSVWHVYDLADKGVLAVLRVCIIGGCFLRKRRLRRRSSCSRSRR
jgi:hypothetical protein